MVYTGNRNGRIHLLVVILVIMDMAYTNFMNYVYFDCVVILAIMDMAYTAWLIENMEE